MGEASYAAACAGVKRADCGFLSTPLALALCGADPCPTVCPTADSSALSAIVAAIPGLTLSSHGCAAGRPRPPTSLRRTHRAASRYSNGSTTRGRAHQRAPRGSPLPARDARDVPVGV